MKLVEFCNIMSGAVVSKKDKSKKNGGIRVLQASDLNEDGTISKPKLTIPEFNGKANQILTEQDVLLVSRGNQKNAVVVAQSLVGMIASNSFLIIRVLGGGINDPAYVAWYLNSKKGQHELEKISRGSNISYISKKNLLDFEIPLPDYDTQKKISETSNLLGKEIKLLNEISKKRKSLIEYLLFDHINKTSTR